MAIVKKIGKRGFTLIELMIVVVIIGILSSLAIYGVQRYVANSKKAEATRMLGRISNSQLAVFDSGVRSAQLLDPGTTGAAEANVLCPSAPGAPASGVPSARKAQPAEADFDNVGWECLQFEFTTPVYYQYSVTTSQGTATSLAGLTPAADGDTFLARAEGNLDGDSVTSQFDRNGVVNLNANGSLQLILATTVLETRPEE